MLEGIKWGGPFFDSLDSLYSTVVTAVVMYPVLIAAIRLNGKRSVSKMNNFDWIVTVAIGSLIGSAIGFESVTILDAVLAIAVLLIMQRAITGALARSQRLEDIVVACPGVLVLDGMVQEDCLHRERVSPSELMSAIRHAGLSGPEDCYAVVLESNAEITVIPRDSARPQGEALAGLRGTPPRAPLTPER